MIDKDIENIKRNYLNFLNKNHEFKLIEGKHINVSTPFIDPFGDNISVMISKDKEDLYAVSDQGYTLWNLKTKGIIELSIDRISKFYNTKLKSDSIIYATGTKRKLS